MLKNVRRLPWRRISDEKKLAISFAILLVFTLAIASYKLMAGRRIEDKTYAYLETVEYTQNDIKDIEIKHAFLNKLLGYNEWRIFVEFQREPNIIFAFTYRDHEIIKQGTKSETAQLDINEIRTNNAMFENGELKQHP